MPVIELELPQLICDALQDAEEHDAAVDIDGIMRRMEWLVEKVIADGWYGAHVLPQLHVLIWGNRRGV